MYDVPLDKLYGKYRVCEGHFELDQFMTETKQKLVWNATPTIFDPALAFEEEGRPRKRKIAQPTQSYIEAEETDDIGVDFVTVNQMAATSDEGVAHVQHIDEPSTSQMAAVYMPEEIKSETLINEGGEPHYVLKNAEPQKRVIYIRIKGKPKQDDQ